MPRSTVSNKKKRIYAEQFYIEKGLTAEEVCEAVGISKPTFYKWREEGEWDNERDYINTAPHQLKKKLIREMERVSGGEKATFDADALSKIAAALGKVEQELNPRTVYSILIEIDRFVAAQYPEKIQDITAIHKEFLRNYISKHG